jgi:tripartite-type tricarboxylate transporter receptor subunit TctC
MTGKSVRAGVVSAFAVAAAVMLALPVTASADPVADFYKGNTINLIIGSGEGGGYDIAGRLAAEYLPRFIPGNPYIVPRNMPGASGMRAADYMFNVAPQDGLTISLPQPTILINKVLDAAARYEPQRFNWLGRLATLKTYGVVWHAAPVQTIEGAKTKEVIMAAAQGTGTGSNVILALNHLVGTKFALVKGYKSVSESSLAMERGEVQGISSTSREFLESRGWLSNKNVTLLYVIGLVRDSKIPDARTIPEFASNEADREVLNTIASESEIGRAILAPPNVPADRLDALRKAFTALVNDPDYIREAARRNIEIDALDGTTVQQMVVKAMSITPDIAERTRRAIR